MKEKDKKKSAMLLQCIVVVLLGAVVWACPSNSGGGSTTSTTSFSCTIGSSVSCPDQASCDACSNGRLGSGCGGCSCSDGSAATVAFVSGGGQLGLNGCRRCGQTVGSTSGSSCN